MLTFSRFLDLALLMIVAWGISLAAIRGGSAAHAQGARSWGLAVAVWALGALLSTPAVSLALVASLETPPADLARLDDPRQRDRTALVVLSSSVRSPTPGDTPAERRLDAEGTARVIGAARVWRRLQTGAVIVTGRAPGDLADANVVAMADLLVIHGVARERILLEPYALNTRQNAELSLRIARARGYTRFVVVTSALHMPRSLREFRRAGVEALAAPRRRAGRERGNVAPHRVGMGPEQRCDSRVSRDAEAVAPGATTRRGRCWYARGLMTTAATDSTEVSIARRAMAERLRALAYLQRDNMLPLLTLFELREWPLEVAWAWIAAGPLAWGASLVASRARRGRGRVRVDGDVVLSEAAGASASFPRGDVVEARVEPSLEGYAVELWRRGGVVLRLGGGVGGGRARPGSTRRASRCTCACRAWCPAPRGTAGASPWGTAS